VTVSAAQPKVPVLPIWAFVADALREVPKTSADPTKASVATISERLAAAIAVVPVTAVSAVTIATGVCAVSVAASLMIKASFLKRAAAKVKVGAAAGALNDK